MEDEIMDSKIFQDLQKTCPQIKNSQFKMCDTDLLHQKINLNLIHNTRNHPNKNSFVFPLFHMTSYYTQGLALRLGKKSQARSCK